LKISHRNAGAGVAKIALRGGVSEPGAQVGSVDHHRNEAVHTKRDCKNDAEDRSATDLSRGKLKSARDKRRRRRASIGNNRGGNHHDGDAGSCMKCLIHGQIKPWPRWRSRAAAVC
jgi:hypothetical protein